MVSQETYGFEDGFVAELLKKYPESEFSIERDVIDQIGLRTLTLDLVVFHRRTNMAVAIFELKPDLNPYEKNVKGNDAVHELAKIIGRDRKNPLSAARFYLVTRGLGGAKYSITLISTSDESSKLAEFDALPSADAAYRERKSNQEKRIKCSRRTLKIICWGITPTVAIALLLSECLFSYELSNNRLVIIGVVLLLSLLPLVSTIKFNELELKFYEEIKEDSASKEKKNL